MFIFLKISRLNLLYNIKSVRIFRCNCIILLLCTTPELQHGVVRSFHFTYFKPTTILTSILYTIKWRLRNSFFNRSPFSIFTGVLLTIQWSLRNSRFNTFNRCPFTVLTGILLTIRWSIRKYSLVE